MVVAERPETHELAVASEAIQALGGLVRAFSAVPSVQRIMMSRAGPLLDMWVLLDEERFDVEEELYLLERTIRQQHALIPITVHVVALSTIPAERLPTPEAVYFERR